MSTGEKILVGMLIGLIAIAWILASGIAKADGAPMVMMNLMEEACFDTGALEKELSEKYHEQESASGVTGDGRQMRLFVSDKTWTLVETRGGGVSCTINAGEDWNAIPTRGPT